jgi:hypothetical protein
MHYSASLLGRDIPCVQGPKGFANGSAPEREVAELFLVGRANCFGENHWICRNAIYARVDQAVQTICLDA